MKKRVRKIPFSRLPLLLLGYAGLLFGVSLLWTTPQTPLTKHLNQIQKSMWQKEPHLALSQLYEQSGQTALAEEELAASRQYARLLKQTVTTDEELRARNQTSWLETKRRWELLVSRYPEYTEGWVQLTYQAFNAQAITEAKKYIAQIKKVNPYRGEQVKKLLGL